MKRLSEQIISTALLIVLASVASHAAAPQVKTQAPGFYRMMLGDCEVTVLSDGTALRPVDEIMTKGAKIRQVFAENHQHGFRGRTAQDGRV